MATTFRSLSLQKKQPTHYLVKFTACGSFQVRSRGFFKCDGEIIDLGLYEVQYGLKKQVATAVVLASGTEMDMTAKKLEREISEDRSPTPSPALSPTPSPRSPTPPPSPPTPPPRSSSNRQSDKMPTLRIPARRRKNTNKQQKKKSTPGNVILTGSPPSSSDEEQPPPAPEILTPQPPTPPPAPVPAPVPTPAPAPGPVPTPTPSPIAPNNIFPDDHRIYRLFDVMISGQSRLFAMMTNFEKRLKAMETEQHKLHAKQDNLEHLLTTQRQATPGLLAVGSDNESDEENTIPADMIIPDDRLNILKDRAHSAGNFASILLKELMPHLFGEENLRNRYNWNGGGINAKREVCPRAKLAVRQYVNHYYPECRKEETFRNVVVHKVNEALRRPSVKACRRRILETPNAN
ncbi:Hypothetical predicted protein [Mytilus galloprovincialis]|uniref:BEN domain-containing protein n=1 Tax=Mytilus galloprovincialis TaxID=29158 RepID=A0A8B6F524_MYTGA|nr:Hypothetical predicted protein [Mytilus galloprovincialis]